MNVAQKKSVIWTEFIYWHGPVFKVKKGTFFEFLCHDYML